MQASGGVGVKWCEGPKESSIDTDVDTVGKYNLSIIIIIIIECVLEYVPIYANRLLSLHVNNFRVLSINMYNLYLCQHNSHAQLYL